MLYVTYNDRGLQDGVGAQVQRIFSLFLLAKRFNLPYIHTPILETEHNVDKDTLALFNSLTALPSVQNKQSCTTVVTPFFDLASLRAHQRGTNHVLVKLKFLHKYIDAHPEVVEPPFPHVFPWVETKLSPVIQIAVHIRRGDVSKDTNADRYIDFSYYRDCIQELHTLMGERPHAFHIYSEGAIREEIANANLPNATPHIDESVVEAFQGFVNADIFLAGFSSLSYSASLIRAKGIVLYPHSFRHAYPTRNLCVRQPSDIGGFREPILHALQSGV